MLIWWLGGWPASTESPPSATLSRNALTRLPARPQKTLQTPDSALARAPRKPVHNGYGRQPLVLALNPCIDTEWRVDEVGWDEKTTVLAERSWAGGKGVNVARWLKHLRSVGALEYRSTGRLPPSQHSITPPLRRSVPKLILPLGGQTGAELAHFLRQEKLAAPLIRLPEATPVNVLGTTAGGPQLPFHPPGPRPSDSGRRAFLPTRD